jgi:hypothetical protein
LRARGEPQWRAGESKKKSELGLKEAPLSSRSNAIPINISPHFEIFWGFVLDLKRHDFGFG